MPPVIRPDRPIPSLSTVRPLPADAQSPQARKARMQEQLRAQVHGPAIVEDIQRIAQWVRTGWVPAYVAPQVTPTEWSAYLNDPTAYPELAARIPAPNEYLPINGLILRRLQIALDTDFKLLNKVLPDMRSLEVEDTTPRVRTLNDLQLAARVAALLPAVEDQTPLSARDTSTTLPATSTILDTSTTSDTLAALTNLIDDPEVLPALPPYDRPDEPGPLPWL